MLVPGWAAVEMLQLRNLLVVCACTCLPAAGQLPERGWFPKGDDRAYWGNETGCTTVAKGTGLRPDSVRVELGAILPARKWQIYFHIPNPCPERREGYMLTACDATPPQLTTEYAVDKGEVTRHHGALSQPARIYTAAYCYRNAH